MRKTIGMAILATALGSVPAPAQPAGEGPRDGRRERGKELSEFLGLSAEQQDKWRALVAEHRETMKPLFEEGQTLREEARKATEDGASNEEVGAAVKAVQAHRDKVRSANQELEGRLTALLSGEQKTKYEAFKAARRSERGEGRHHRGPRRRGGAGAEPPPES